MYKILAGVAVLVVLIAGFFLYEGSEDSEGQAISEMESTESSEKMDTGYTGYEKKVESTSDSSESSAAALDKFKEKYGIDLSNINISKELTNFSLLHSVPKFYDQAMAEKINHELDERMAYNSGILFGEIFDFLHENDLDSNPKLKGMLFSLMADLDERNNEALKTLSLSALKAYEPSEEVNELKNFENASDNEEISSIIRIYDAFLISSESDPRKSYTQTIDLIKEEPNEAFRQGVISSLLESGDNPKELIKKLESDGVKIDKRLIMQLGQ